MVHMAMKVERKLIRKGTTRYTLASSNPWKTKCSNERRNEAIMIEPPKAREYFSSKNMYKAESQPQKNWNI